MEKIKSNEQEGTNVEPAKGRKRKKSLKVDAHETSGEAGPSTKEVDPITATIDAVLANASSISPTVEKAKKMKRVKKQDAETAGDDADENDDSSTAGNEKAILLKEDVTV